MNDQYRAADTQSPRSAGGANHRDILLWAALIGGAVLNGLLQLIGLVLLAIPFGLAAIASGVLIVVRYFQRRR